ncbi:sugar transferase [Mangrovibacillus sp. Mu-81]|uniref:sugar transferase n=1 Tax=Mangrovibacillus sp. Mu-81 TaxID=3121478 RepID=UPI002FE43319
MKENTTQQIKGNYLSSNNEFYLIIKRIMDIILSLIGIIIFSPVFLYVSIRILLEDGKPIFFKQKRSGVNGETFYIYKFRSMKVTNNHSPGKSPYDWENGVPDDFVFKSTKEFHPSVTNIGRIIRKYSLDELPQFFNVLKGEMSMVGPRPEIVEITACYSEHQFQRLFAKPGITGWAQVNGRSEIPHGEKIEYDLYYVKNNSFLLDLRILFKTIVNTVLAKDSI